LYYLYLFFGAYSDSSSVSSSDSSSDSSTQGSDDEEFVVDMPLDRVYNVAEDFPDITEISPDSLDFESETQLLEVRFISLLIFSPYCSHESRLFNSFRRRKFCKENPTH
jgi:hypothetical protein